MCGIREHKITKPSIANGATEKQMSNMQAVLSITGRTSEKADQEHGQYI